MLQALGEAVDGVVLEGQNVDAVFLGLVGIAYAEVELDGGVGLLDVLGVDVVLDDGGAGGGKVADLQPPSAAGSVDVFVFDDDVPRDDARTRRRAGVGAR